MNKLYPYAFEIRGPQGMWARPDTGSEPFSYPVPTPTGVEGIFRNIVSIVGTKLHVVAIGVCNKPSYSDCSFNSHSPFRKDTLRKSGCACQIHATALEYPKFQILGLIENTDAKHPKHLKTNNAHSCQYQFFRRMKLERCFDTPSLGWRQFHADYMGKFETPVETGYYETIMSYPNSQNVFGKVDIKRGILQLDPKEKAITKNGMLAFENEDYQSQIEKFFRRF